jgi:5-methylcytosine-specific restriction endonuclease McrA
MRTRDYLFSLGCDLSTAKAISYAHYTLAQAKLSWEEHKQQFYQLQPAYTGRVRETHLSQRTKDEVYSRSDGWCAYCSKELDFDLLSTVSGPNIDHRIPVSRGGDDSLENLALVCRTCNQRKGVRTVEEFARCPDDPITALTFTLGSKGTLYLLTWENEERPLSEVFLALEAIERANRHG